MLVAPDDDSRGAHRARIADREGYAEAELDQIGDMEGRPTTSRIMSAYQGALEGEVSIVTYRPGFLTRRQFSRAVAASLPGNFKGPQFSFRRTLQSQSETLYESQLQQERQTACLPAPHPSGSPSSASARSCATSIFRPSPRTRTSNSSPPPAATARSRASPTSRPSRRCSTPMPRHRRGIALHAAAVPLRTRRARRWMPASTSSWKSRPAPPSARSRTCKRLADAKGVSLFASWHSRYAPAVEAARAFLAGTTIRAARIDWKEDVRRWHPEPGLDLAGRRLRRVRSRHQRAVDRHPHPACDVHHCGQARLPRKPRRADRRQVSFRDLDGVPVPMDFDWLQTGPQTWDISAETDAGTMVLSSGGAKLAIDGRIVHEEPEAEYPMLYRAVCRDRRRRHVRCRPRAAAACRRRLHARQAQRGRGFFD